MKQILDDIIVMGPLTPARWLSERQKITVSLNWLFGKIQWFKSTF